MKYATFTVDKTLSWKFTPREQTLTCDRCGIIWSRRYEDYRGMQDIDFIICACGEIICQLSDLKVT